MLETVRHEREALAQASLKGIQETTLAKEACVHAIQHAETERLKKLGVLAMAWKRPMRDITVNGLAIEVQGHDPKLAEQLRSAFNALTLLISRITEQNDDNRAFLEKSLEHVNEMKKNVLGEAIPRSNTYNQQGQRQGQTGGARLLSKEA
jgi:hypothetical protein